MRLLNTLKYKYYNIKISCKNLFNWFNIIWNDREYDYLFMLKIEKKKIEQMIKFYSNDYYGKDTTLKELKFANHLLDLIINEKYNDYISYDGTVQAKMNDDGKTWSCDLPTMHFNHYVNLKNVQRFIPHLKYSGLKNSNYIEFIKMTLYEAKLWHLYFRYKEYKMQNWWD